MQMRGSPLTHTLWFVNNENPSVKTICKFTGETLPVLPPAHVLASDGQVVRHQGARVLASPHLQPLREDV